MKGHEELIKEEGGGGERGGEDMQWLFVHGKGEGGNLVQICRKYRPARPTYTNGKISLMSQTQILI